MSKEPIYRIKIEVIGAEDEECKLDETMREVDCSGFAILFNQGDHTSTLLHNTSVIDIARALTGDGNMMAASLIAQAICEGRKYIRTERNPLADLIKTMSK